MESLLGTDLRSSMFFPSSPLSLSSRDEVSDSLKGLFREGPIVLLLKFLVTADLSVASSVYIAGGFNPKLACLRLLSAELFASLLAFSKRIICAMIFRFSVK